MNNPNEIFNCLGVDGKGGQNGLFSVCRISEFYPSGFEWTFKIIISTFNLIMVSVILFMDKYKIIDTSDLKTVLMALTHLSKNIDGKGFHAVQRIPFILRDASVQFKCHFRECSQTGAHECAYLRATSRQRMLRDS